MEVFKVIMPRLGVNEEFVSIGKWLVESGTKVKIGQPIASLETSKETQDLLAEQEGFLFYNNKLPSEVRIGSEIAVITEDPNYKIDNSIISNEKIKITSKAQLIIDKYGLDINQFRDKTIVREKDVLSFISSTNSIERSKANDLIIVSGGSLSKMYIDTIRLNKAYNIHGITDPSKEINSNILGIPVLGGDDILEKLRKEGYMTAVNAVGSITIDNNSSLFYLRKNIFNKIKSYDFFMPTILHPSAQIAPSALLGEGVLVMENASIGSEAIIGDDCLINTGAIVSHDCKIGNHSRLSPGAILAGGVEIGENTLIGMGVTIYINVKIGKNVIIANGKNIFGDVPDNTVIK